MDVHCPSFDITGARYPASGNSGIQKRAQGFREDRGGPKEGKMGQGRQETVDLWVEWPGKRVVLGSCT